MNATPRMLRPLFTILLLLCYLQGLYCSEIPHRPNNFSENKADVSAKVDGTSSANNSLASDAAVPMHNQLQLTIEQQQVVTSGAVTDNRRQRRHIGSIAAFRGLPGPFNKFNPAEWPLTAGWERKGPAGSEKMTPGLDLDSADNTYGEVIKDKRYPDDPQLAIQNNSQLPSLNPTRSSSASGNSNMNRNLEIVAPPHNEARAKAVNRLLRLLSEAKAKSARVNSISKKFLGALARSNGLPASKMVTPSVQYKGSIAIPLPGKRNFNNRGLSRSESPETAIQRLELASQPEADSIDDMYSDDDVNLVSEVDDDQLDDDYEEAVNPIKRNIASLAAKGGWARPSRAYNRVPHFSY